MAPFWVLKQLSTPGKRLLAIGMGYNVHVERVMITSLEDCFKKYKIRYEMNRSTKIMTLFNESQILFGSAENPGSLEGPHVDGGAWLDEAGYMGRAAWDVAKRRTDYWQSPLLITTIPYFQNWVKKDLYDHVEGLCDCARRGVKCVRDTIDWIPCTTADNLDYSREVLEQNKSQRRPEYYQIYHEGKFAKPIGIIYGEPDNADVIFDPEIEFPDGMPSDWPCYSGHDFGISNPNAAVWGRLAPDDTLYIVAEYQAPEMTMKQHISRWRQAGLDYVDGAYGDPAGADQMLTAAENGFPMEPANNDITFGIDLAYDRFITGRLRIARECETLLDFRSQYVWKKNPANEDEVFDIPQKPQPAEHMMDALRYLCTGIFEYQLGLPGENKTEVAVRSRKFLGKRSA